MRGSWPATLYLIRHGESAGNLARERALSTRAETIDIADRDVDVALSSLGERQAGALGRWFGRNIEPMDAVLSSPYLRAMQTAAIVSKAAGWTTARHVVDDNLREKEFGTLDRLTRRGIEHRYPEQAVLRERIGKFNYRPPDGESWADVTLRLRSAVASLRTDFRGLHVALVAHQVVILCLRYIIEGMEVAQLLRIDAAAEIANCSVTSYVYDDITDRLLLRTFDARTPLESENEVVTAEPAAEHLEPHG